MLTMSSSSSKISFSYDSFGRIISEKSSTGEIKYSYNNAGLLFEKISEIRGSNQEFSTKYFYDELDRVIKVSSQAGDYIYTYDKKGRISSLSISTPSESSVPAAPELGVGGCFVVNYSYDKVGRLLSKTVFKPSENSTYSLCSYTYDKLDRRVKAEVNGVKWVYAYDDKNQLVAAKATTENSEKELYKYSYDEIGNRLSDVNNQYAYNSLNRIVSSDPKTENLKPSFTADYLVGTVL